MRRMRYRWNAAAVVAIAAVGACAQKAQPHTYVGTWDPAILTARGVTLLTADHLGISFGKDEFCYLRFAAECYPSDYSDLGGAVSVTLDGEPNAMLLVVTEEGYLIVQRGDQQALYVRR